jgi:hypothetical protein
MKFILFLALSICFTPLEASEVEDVRQSLKALLNSILQKSNKRPTQAAAKSLLKEFSVENCENQKINWMDVILMKESATLTYTFRQGCDVEGTIRPAILKTFPTDLKLKNLQSFTRLQSENRINYSIESMPVMNLEIRSATLSSKRGKILFEADYGVRINPLKNENPVEENLGGQVWITEIFGKKVSIKANIKVD